MREIGSQLWVASAQIILFQSSRNEQKKPPTLFLSKSTSRKDRDHNIKVKIKIFLNFHASGLSM